MPKTGMFNRRQTCESRSQSPVVWIAEEMETKRSKPIDKASRGHLRQPTACARLGITPSLAEECCGPRLIERDTGP